MMLNTIVIIAVLLTNIIAVLVSVVWQGLIGDEAIEVELNVRTLQDLKTTICLFFEQDPGAIDMSKMRVYRVTKAGKHRWLTTDAVVQHFTEDTELQVKMMA
jgi:hypothetical protein